MSTEHEQRQLEELAEQYYDELLQCGESDESAQLQTAVALEMWKRMLAKPH